MAFASDSTTAPARPLLPLVPFVFRPAAPVDDPRSAEELLEEIRRTIERQADAPELPPEPFLTAAGEAESITGLLRLPALLPSLSTALSRRRAIFGAFDAEATHG